MMTYYRAWENRRFVRTLLREKQPEFADVLESAVREAPCLRGPTIEPGLVLREQVGWEGRASRR
jgi:hypothetical protein